MLRKWIYDSLSDSPELTSIVSDRIYQATSLLEVPSVKPFIEYRLGTNFNVLSGDDNPTAISQPLQIFVHDNPGDFARIDSIHKLLKTILINSSQGDLIRCTWLEDGEDLRDDEMFTIFRYSRYQLIHS